MNQDDEPTRAEQALAAELAELIDGSHRSGRVQLDRASGHETHELVEFARLVALSNARLNSDIESKVRGKLLAHAKRLRRQGAQSTSFGPVWWRWLGLGLPVLIVCFLIIRGIDKATSTSAEAFSYSPAATAPESQAARFNIDHQPADQELKQLVQAQAIALAERSDRSLSEKAQDDLNAAWGRYRTSLLTELAAK